MALAPSDELIDETVSLLLALPGGGGAAVQIANEPERAVQAWWVARARRAQEIVSNHDTLLADLIGGN